MAKSLNKRVCILKSCFEEVFVKTLLAVSCEMAFVMFQEAKVAQARLIDRLVGFRMLGKFELEWIVIGDEVNIVKSHFGEYIEVDDLWARVRVKALVY